MNDRATAAGLEEAGTGALRPGRSIVGFGACPVAGGDDPDVLDALTAAVTACVEIFDEPHRSPSNAEDSGSRTGQLCAPTLAWCDRLDDHGGTVSGPGGSSARSGEPPFRSSIRLCPAWRGYGGGDPHRRPQTTQRLMTIGTMTLTASTPLAVRAARQALAVQLDRWECDRAPDALLVLLRARHERGRARGRRHSHPGRARAADGAVRGPRRRARRADRGRPCRAGARIWAACRRPAERALGLEPDSHREGGVVRHPVLRGRPRLTVRRVRSRWAR